MTRAEKKLIEVALKVGCGNKVREGTPKTCGAPLCKASRAVWLERQKKAR